MTIRMRVTAAAAALTIALGGGQVSAQVTTPRSYSKLFVFGDSLVDSGNAQAGRRQAGGADPAPAAAGYVGGRFSNGYNFADYLSTGLFGTPATAFAAGGSNFAVGGATARPRVGDEGSPSFGEQIGLFRTSGQTIASDSLVLLTFGGNDLRTILAGIAASPTTPFDPATGFKATTDAFSAGLTALYGQGARNFVVVGLPDLGQIPEVTGNGRFPVNSIATDLSKALNAQIQGTLATFQTGKAGSTQYYSLLDLQTRFASDPAAFGLPASLNRVNQCIGTAAAPTCNGYVYFDDKHPTSQIHQVIARDLAFALGVSAIPEPASWALMIVGIGATGAMLRRRRPPVRAAA